VPSGRPGSRASAGVLLAEVRAPPVRVAAVRRSLLRAPANELGDVDEWA
jgi:hypothetical protein